MVRNKIIPRSDIKIIATYIHVLFCFFSGGQILHGWHGGHGRQGTGLQDGSFDNEVWRRLGKEEEEEETRRSDKVGHGGQEAQGAQGAQGKQGAQG
jgi:hypothetical protein